MIVDTEKVLWEASVPVSGCIPSSRQGAKVVVRSAVNGTEDHERINGDFKRRVFIREKAGTKRKTLSHGKASRMDDL